MLFIQRNLSGHHISNVDQFNSIEIYKENIVTFLQAATAAEKDNENQDKSDFKMRFHNVTSLFLLFKSDVTSSYSSLSSFASLTQSQTSFYDINEHKPSGISINYKLAIYFDSI